MIDSPDVMSASSDAPNESLEESTTETTDQVTEPPVDEEKVEETKKDEEGTTDASSESDSGTDSPAKKDKSPLQERINEITGKRRAAERKSEALEQEVEYWKQQAQAVSNPEPVGVKPTLESCEYDEARYEESLLAWNQQQQAKKDEEAAQAQAAVIKQQRQVVFAESGAKFAESTPDYFAVIQNPAFVQSETMAEAIFASDIGPQLAYTLGSNQELAAAINNMPPTEALLALGRLEASLSFEPSAPPAKPVTKAPAPIKPVGSSAVVDKTPEDMSYAEYKAHRMKKRA